MKKINLLTTDNTPNSFALNFPLCLHQKKLRALGTDVRLFFNIEEALFDCDVLCVNSKYFRTWWPTNKAGILASLSAFKDRVSTLLWFDTGDSSGTTQFQVLPYVDGYYKNQILKDKRAYLQSYYGSRLFTDYYHRECDIEDEDVFYTTCVPSENDLKKIDVSWNFGLGDYGVHANFYGKLRKYLTVPYRFSIHFVPPKKSRSLDITCRLGRSYTRNTICYQRNRITQILGRRYGVSTERVSRKAYYRELRNAKVGVSPFGWGEMAYRDFETFINGAALFKPDMSYIRTWPDIFKEGETYVAHRWDLSDLPDRLDELISGDRHLEIARNAQSLYRKYLFEPEGHQAFCQRFVNMIERHTRTENTDLSIAS